MTNSENPNTLADLLTGIGALAELSRALYTQFINNDFNDQQALYLTSNYITALSLSGKK